MHKFYAVTLADLATQIEPGKFPLQQKQIYRALAKAGRPMIGSEVIKLAIKEESLITRQEPATLAAWYFSIKRRPACVRLVNELDTVEEPTPTSMDILAGLVS